MRTLALTAAIKAACEAALLSSAPAAGPVPQATIKAACEAAGLASAPPAAAAGPTPQTTTPGPPPAAAAGPDPQTATPASGVNGVIPAASQASRLGPPTDVSPAVEAAADAEAHVLLPPDGSDAAVTTSLLPRGNGNKRAAGKAAVEGPAKKKAK